MRARYYDPEVGRFITTDPITGNPASPQTLNAYAYSLNNPVNLTDPAGLSPVYMHKPGSVQSQITTMFVLCSPVLGYAGVAAAQYVMPIMLGSAPVIQKAVPRAAPAVRQAAPVIGKCEDIVQKGAQTHHWVTIYANANNCKGPIVQRIKSIVVDEMGLKLEDAWNKTLMMGHKGSHPYEYYRDLLIAVEKAKLVVSTIDDVAARGRAFINELQGGFMKAVMDNPALLHKGGYR